MGCWLLKAHAKGYAGIWNGIGVDEFEIEFSRNNIVIIRGDNGKGKSTLLFSILQPLDDDSECIVPGHAGRKTLTYDIDGEVYTFDIMYPLSKEFDDNHVLKRGTTKGYITHHTSNGPVQMIPSGSITQYKQIVQSIFGLDSNFMSLLRMSAENGGLVGKTPAERRKYISYVMDEVTQYYEMQSQAKKQDTICDKRMKDLSYELNMIGDVTNIDAMIDRTASIIQEMERNIEISKQQITKAGSKIEYLDPNSELRNKFNTLMNAQKSNSVQKENILGYVEALYQSNPTFPRMFLDDVSDYYLKTKDSLADLKSKNTYNTMNMKTYIEQRDSLNLEIQQIQAQIDSLNLNFNYEDLLEQLSFINHNIASYEAFFQQLNITNALSISKDEYVIALNALKSMDDMLNVIQVQYRSSIIKGAIKYLDQNIDYISDIDVIRNNIDTVEASIKSAENEQNYYYGLLDRMKVLQSRPSNCSINNCPFIEDAIECSNKQPELNIQRLSDQISTLRKQVTELENKLDTTSQMYECTRMLNQFISIFTMNKSVIEKLPINNNMTNIDQMMQCIIDDKNPFFKLDDLYQYIDKASIFEEYKLALKMKSDMEKDKLLYDNKSEQCEVLKKSLDDKLGKLEEVSKTIGNIVADTNKTSFVIDVLESNIPLIETLLSYHKDYVLIEENNMRIDESLKEIESSMKEVAQLIEISNVEREKLSVFMEQIKPYQRDLEKLKYSKQLAQQYQTSYDAVSKEYKFNSVIKKYLDPTKCGIQNEYIKTYFDRIITESNRILTTLFDGKLTLQPVNLANGKFTIPCYSNNTNMVMSDVKLCSRSQKSSINLIMAAVMQYSANSNYTILDLDETDEGYDTNNRFAFSSILNLFVQEYGITQIFISTHTMEFDDSKSDIIYLNDGGIHIEYKSH